MPKKMNQDMIFGLDIGTSKIAALVGAVDSSNDLDIIGFGSHPSRGLKRGVVVNIDSTVNSIQRAIEKAELTSGCRVRSAFAGIAGSHIKSLNSHGIVAIRDSEVKHSDLTRVIDAAKAVAIPADQKILHVLPQEFTIDAQSGIREPLGMSGVRLEAKVHIVTGAVSAAQNIANCIKKCGLQVNDIILEQLASSHSVLTDDEKELGVCMIDIGGGTTDMAIFTEGAIRHTAVLPIAGDHVTNDLALALRTPTQYAETLKLKYATVLPDSIDAAETIEILSVASRPPKQIPKKSIAHVVSARYAELFSLILSELKRSGFIDNIFAGIVLTGGASKIPGILTLAENIFNVPVRAGMPHNVSGLQEIRNDPIYATGVGLLLHAVQQRQMNQMLPSLQRAGFKGIFNRMRQWFNGNF